jgi:hypothetical protein
MINDKTVEEWDREYEVLEQKAYDTNCRNCGNLAWRLDGTGNIDYICADTPRCHNGCQCGGVPIKEEDFDKPVCKGRDFIQVGEGKGIIEQPAGSPSKARLKETIKQKLHGYSPMIQEKILSNLDKSKYWQLKKIDEMIA